MRCWILQRSPSCSPGKFSYTMCLWSARWTSAGSLKTILKNKIFKIQRTLDLSELRLSTPMRSPSSSSAMDISFVSLSLWMRSDSWLRPPDRPTICPPIRPTDRLYTVTPSDCPTSVRPPISHARTHVRPTVRASYHALHPSPTRAPRSHALRTQSLIDLIRKYFPIEGIRLSTVSSLTTCVFETLSGSAKRRQLRVTKITVKVKKWRYDKMDRRSDTISTRGGGEISILSISSRITLLSALSEFINTGEIDLNQCDVTVWILYIFDWSLNVLWSLNRYLLSLWNCNYDFMGKYFEKGAYCVSLYNDVFDEVLKQ